MQSVLETATMSSVLPRLPEGIISSINSYNRTTYPDNRVSTRFLYRLNPATFDNPVGEFDCQIVIIWNGNIARYWRNRASENWILSLFNQRYINTPRDDGKDAKRIEINNKLRTFPNYQTIFGSDDLQRVGLYSIDSSLSNDYGIQLKLTFRYIREENEEGFINVDFRSDRGTRMREAATFLAAHTMVETMKYLIPAPDTPLQDYLTIEVYNEDRVLINQKGEEHLRRGYNRETSRYIDRRNDYKLLLQDDQRIYSFDFWSDHIDTTPAAGREGRSRSNWTKTPFTLVNNKRLPLSSGKEGATMTKLKLKF